MYYILLRFQNQCVFRINNFEDNLIANHSKVIRISSVYTILLSKLD